MMDCEAVEYLGLQFPSILEHDKSMADAVDVGINVRNNFGLTIARENGMDLA
jgi:hypothetical protein